MTDLLQRLQDYEVGRGGFHPPICDEAHAALAAQEAEIKRLQEALQGMVDFYGDHNDNFSEEARAKARAALSSGTGDSR